MRFSFVVSGEKTEVNKGALAACNGDERQVLLPVYTLPFRGIKRS